ncbi:MAG: nucleotidyltransferase family protein [Gallionellaceae bacterium]|jgi:MurNAc alpha-1-phosphate uridylyltransferase|nr:nucleotidyltransferase family protein [Gallionellaceae bacterium]
MRAMILAAGRGERMRPLTDHTPKPLLQVGGKPLIVWHLERLAQAGITDIIINHAHLGSQIEHRLGDGSAWGVAIRYSAEPRGALETAGGVAQALPLLGREPFFLISADIYVEADYRELAAANALRDGATAFMWMVDNPPWHSGGDFALDGNYLALEGATKLTYANLGVFHPAFFADVEPGTRLPMSPLFKRAIAQRQIRAARFVGMWDNIGTPEQLRALDALLHRRASA